MKVFFPFCRLEEGRDGRRDPIQYSEKAGDKGKHCNAEKWRGGRRQSFNDGGSRERRCEVTGHPHLLSGVDQEIRESNSSHTHENKIE